MNPGAGVLDRLAGVLEESVEEAFRRGRKSVVSVTCQSEVIDPVATVFASRRADDEWFCWEQAGGREALAGLGTAEAVVSRGPDRFTDLASECAHLSGEAIVADLDDCSIRTGPVWLGGFAFDDDGGRSPEWIAFPPARMVLPELLLERSGDRTTMTVNLVVSGATDTEGAVEAALTRVAGLIEKDLPLLDPAPGSSTTIESSGDPGQFERSVAEASRRIRAGRLDKVVLARKVTLDSVVQFDSAALFGAIREGFPSCFNFCVGTPESAFIGASPELLVSSEGRTVAAVGLAGSSRRSSDPAVDDHLGQRLLASAKDRSEHDFVVRRIVDSLARLSIWVEAAPEPEVVKVANIQHLATPVVAQLAEPKTAIELAGKLHPTPAVGGEPWGEARRVIDEVEGLDRGWYAGPVGWMDGSGDGVFCVALRSALLEGRKAWLYAGVGVVADSDPEAELAETEIKLDALLPLLAD